MPCPKLQYPHQNYPDSNDTKSYKHKRQHHLAYMLSSYQILRGISHSPPKRNKQNLYHNTHMNFLNQFLLPCYSPPSPLHTYISHNTHFPDCYTPSYHLVISQLTNFHTQDFAHIDLICSRLSIGYYKHHLKDHRQSHSPYHPLVPDILGHSEGLLQNTQYYFPPYLNLLVLAPSYLLL